MTTVVPCTNCSIAAGATPDLAIASMMPSPKAGGVEGALANPTVTACLVQIDQIGKRAADIRRQPHERLRP